VTFYRSLVDMHTVRRLGARTILHVHGAHFDAFHEEGSALRRLLIRRGLSRADRVVALSSRWADRLARIAPKARITVIENAVDFPPRPPARDARDTCRFLLLARMDGWKGIDDLLDACALLRGHGAAFQLTLAGPPGTAGDAAGLETKIERRALGTMVRYAGPVQGADKSALLSHADVYVQPSHHEGMPIAVLEALGFGLPIVATAVGALGEVVDHGRQGLIVPPRKPELLADAMRRLAIDPALRRTMSLAARSLAEARFSVDRFREDLAFLYEDMHTSATTTRPIALRDTRTDPVAASPGRHFGASPATR
jgi:glycosyltransferase involved in cell wall biosynthesis